MDMETNTSDTQRRISKLARDAERLYNLLDSLFRGQVSSVIGSGMTVSSH